jgi:hypothetical protein
VTDIRRKITLEPTGAPVCLGCSAWAGSWQVGSLDSFHTAHRANSRRRLLLQPSSVNTASYSTDVHTMSPGIFPWLMEAVASRPKLNLQNGRQHRDHQCFMITGYHQFRVLNSLFVSANSSSSHLGPLIASAAPKLRCRSGSSVSVRTGASCSFRIRNLLELNPVLSQLWGDS